MIYLNVLSSPSSESIDVTLLKFGLHYSFGDKIKYLIRNMEAELELLAILQDKCVNVSMKENFHKYLQSSTNITTSNIYRNKDRTVALLNSLIKNDNIFILSVDK